MFLRRTIHLISLVPLLALFLSSGCKTAPTAANGSATGPAATTSESASSHAIETETVTPQPIAGSILATGKVLVSEDRVAALGPVHDGRLVRLYAGQGSLVRKGQKLAILNRRISTTGPTISGAGRVTKCAPNIRGLRSSSPSLPMTAQRCSMRRP
jgi:multidrug efflux pump subunit AcrA (membrane-fusion protein)